MLGSHAKTRNLRLPVLCPRTVYLSLLLNSRTRNSRDQTGDFEASEAEKKMFEDLLEKAPAF